MAAWPYDMNTEAIKLFACPYCGVAKGERCRTKSGGRVRTAWPHEDRVRPLREAFYAGWEEAELGIIHHWTVMTAEEFDAMLTARQKSNLQRAARLVRETLKRS